MIEASPVHATLPASDLAWARRWYAEKMGLTPVREDEVGLWYEFTDSRLLIYETSSAGTAQNTSAEWLVDAIDAVMADLRKRGVEFEEYDFPGLKTKNGVAMIGQHKSAWFKDSEGNTLSLDEPPPGWAS